MGRRRALVLALVHLIIALHITQWWVSGRTVSPVEPSESMETLELGSLNAGFIFFGVAILSTLVFGRFFCGWGCHIVALQDLCGWAMKKVGVRPKPFRSRLLIWAPLVLALYMFVWPSAKRLAIVPLLDRVWPAAVDWIGRPSPWPAHGVESHLMVEDFWATFPGLAIAIPFLVICGFATVYFLGAKGFCTYGCPYGGFFGVADRVAPGRIVVDNDRCDGNAHCTAVCTSNVRVHEEIREHGMVVNPGCMKCMDCISACPTNALSFKIVTPPIARKAKPRERERAPRRYDLSWSEELLLALVMLATFVAVRGAYGLIPMLMAIGIAPCVAFMVWKSVRTVRDANVRIPWVQLKLKGRVRAGGWVFLAITLLLVVAIAHTGLVQSHKAKGLRAMQGVDVPPAVFVNAAAPPPALVEVASKAEPDLRAAAPVALGGIALLPDPEVCTSLADAAVLLGDRETARRATQALIDTYGERDKWVADVAAYMITSDNAPDAIAMLRDVLARHPDFWQSADVLVDQVASTEGPAAAIGVIDDCLARLDDSWRTRAARSRFHTRRGQALVWNRAPTDEAILAFERAVELGPKNTEALETLANALLTFRGDADGAVDAMERATRADPIKIERWVRLAHIYGVLGRADDVRDTFRRAAPYARGWTQAEPDIARHWLVLAEFRLLGGDPDAALDVLREGDGRAGFTPEQREAALRLLQQEGANAQAAQWIREIGGR